MRTSALVGALMLGASLLPATAAAQERSGSVQVKAFATAVLPDGKISEVETDIVGLPAATQTEANDNVVPTVAIEYFLSENLSLETICCLTQHDVDAISGLPGAELVADAKLIPATITAKYHFDLGAAKPYIGAGAAYFIFLGEDPGAATLPLGVTDFDLSDEFGLALQAGVDVPLNDRGLGISLDAKRYFIDTTARWFVGDTVAIQTEHQLDPWVVSAGLAYRF
ncbi:OmpW family outer membrane protein [Qipengyuania sp. DY56-A-20]|jgi:outer membrane protein|uniref:OmpW family outer membrane protein n=1 Tax=Qipengyuania benthica TaxID=3067651 RepID=A0ABT9H630_9SPHN|nr:OmpW family outer membrane protein [Qipengyuania sp. DY56-A-20]MDP4538774.1 OmpW family outer membrane protein [Qipengyuania sp. DY56-A-20]